MTEARKHPVGMQGSAPRFCELALATLTLLVASCAVQQHPPEQNSQWQAPNYQAELEKAREHWTTKEPTAEEKAITQQKLIAYYAGLTQSIKALDDGTSPADVVAKAAVSENAKKLREWKAAELANVARTNDYEAQQVAASLNTLPSPGLLNEATSLVLRNRKGALPDMQ